MSGIRHVTTVLGRLVYLHLG